MKPKAGLLVRLMLLMLGLLVVSTGVFAVLIYMINDRFEEQLLDRQVSVELNEYIESLAEQGSTPFPPRVNQQFYLERHADIQPIPEAFRFPEPGIYHSVEAAGRVYHLAIRDMENDRAYLAIDITELEKQETRLRWLLLVGVLAISSLAILLGFWLSRRIIQPISQLAEEMTRLEPGQRRTSSSRVHGYEAELISNAFDRYLKRMDDYVEREQSFSAAASHELRTPLSVISTSIELLMTEKNLPARVQTQLKRIEQSAQRMSELVTTFLFLAREKPELPAVDTETCLCTLVRQVADDRRHLVNSKNIKFEVHCGEPARIPAPESHIAIVVGNLINNAIFYTQTGSVTVEQKGTRVIVRDTGTGIAPEDMENIFSRSYRGQHSQGHGLGLYIAKSICDRYGWELRLESVPGQGTTAHLMLSSRPAAVYI